MDKKRFLEQLKRPTGWLLATVYILTTVFIAGAIAVLFVDYVGTPLEIVAYCLFALAACGLGYSVYTLVLYLPPLKRKLTAWMHTVPFLHKLMQNYGFRTVLFSAFSLFFSVAYAVYNGVIAILLLSVWYGALAGYYILLVSIRGGIALYHGKNRGKERSEITEIKKYRTCGVLLIVTILALSAAILQMVVENAGFQRLGLTIYASAAYTFYKGTMAILNIFKTKRKKSGYTVRALRNVNLADAAVSVLALQTAMFHAFTPEPSSGTRIANALTGGAVCLLVLIVGIVMIVNANKALKEKRAEFSAEEGYEI